MPGSGEPRLTIQHACRAYQLPPPPPPPPPPELPPPLKPEPLDLGALVTVEATLEEKPEKPPENATTLNALVP